MKYRVREEMSVHVKALGREVPLQPANELDDAFPEDAAVIAEWAPRGLVRAVNVSGEDGVKNAKRIKTT